MDMGVSYPTQMAHGWFHKRSTQMQHLKKSFGPWIIAMSGLDTNTDTLSPHHNVSLHLSPLNTLTCKCTPEWQQKQKHCEISCKLKS